MPAEPPPITVETNGIAYPAADGAIRLPASTGEIFVTIGDMLNGQRIRYQLDGIDRHWNERADNMRIAVIFYDHAGNHLDEQSFYSSGVSSGWRGTVDNSTFSHRSETLTVPAHTASLGLFMSSAGPPSAMGVFVVANLTISKQQINGGPLILWNSKLTAKPPGWKPQGGRPSMATIVSVNNGHAFRILDNSFATHAEWHLEKNHAIPVTVGDRILLEWDEMFNIGSGTRIEALYHFLKPGHYELRANILDAAGHPTATTTNLTLILPRPHWQNPWLWAGGLLVFSVTVIWSVRRIVSVKVKHHVERMEHAHLLEQERLRITRNIHDDLGARLTHVSLISSLAENETDSSPVREKFEQISAMTREMVASLYETVWTINPANDTLESLVTFLCQLLQKLCNPANIRSRINVPAIPANPHVSGDLRHHLNLAVKEAINNAIKHSGAQVIELGIRLEHDTLTIWVKDNGKGFDQGAVKEGYGIANLQSRMASISARALINSAPNQGTTVTLEDIKI